MALCHLICNSKKRDAWIELLGIALICVLGPSSSPHSSPLSSPEEANFVNDLMICSCITLGHFTCELIMNNTLVPEQCQVAHMPGVQYWPGPVLLLAVPLSSPNSDGLAAQFHHENFHGPTITERHWSASNASSCFRNALSNDLQHDLQCKVISEVISRVISAVKKDWEQIKTKEIFWTKLVILFEF